MDRPSKRQRTDGDEQASTPDSLSRAISPPRKHQRREARILRSPWQLTWIRDLPEELNQDAVSLKDLLGDPLIRECWEFNYLHDIPFLMDAFDPDTRHLVKVHVVHGFWKQEDPHRLMLSVSAGFYPFRERLLPCALLTFCSKTLRISTMFSSMLLQCRKCLALITQR